MNSVNLCHCSSTSEKIAHNIRCSKIYMITESYVICVSPCYHEVQPLQSMHIGLLHSRLKRTFDKAEHVACKMARNFKLHKERTAPKHIRFYAIAYFRTGATNAIERTYLGTFPIVFS